MKDTKARILDAAERLFARHGVQGASLRLITQKAGVNLAAINYHFGSKENLVGAVLKRVILELDRERDRLMNEARVRAGDGPLSVEDIVRAYMMPWVRFQERQPEYVRVIARTYTSRRRPEGLFREIVDRASRKAYTGFTEALFEALPHIPRKVLLKRVNLAVATAASFLLSPWLIEGLQELSGQRMDEKVLMDSVVRLLKMGVPGEKKPGSRRPPFG